MKYSFLMPYKNRVDQFHNTIISLLHWYGDRDDWEVIVIIDGLSERVSIPNNDKRVKIHRVNRTNGDVNPAPLFNLAAQKAKGDYFVITNPECYHVSDVLGWMDKIFAKDPGGYAVAACDHVKNIGMIDEYRPSLGTHLEVYQHSFHRNVLYHFCSALSRERWTELGGFDERYACGYACEDDDFRDRVVCAGIPWYVNDTVKVLHQEHSKYKHDPNISSRYKHNIALLQDTSRKRGFTFNLRAFRVPLNDPRNRA